MAVTGELDVSGASLLEAVLQHVRERCDDGAPVPVDLGGVRYADTHGLAPVLDGAVHIRSASSAVRRVLRLLGQPIPVPRSSSGGLGG